MSEKQQREYQINIHEHCEARRRIAEEPVIVDDCRERQLARGAKTYEWSISFRLLRDQPVGEAEEDDDSCHEMQPNRRRPRELEQTRGQRVAYEE